MIRRAGRLFLRHDAAAHAAAALVLLVVIDVAPGAADAQTGCPPFGPTRITLQPVYPNPAIDTALDLMGLKERARERDAQHGEHGQPLGLTVAKLIGDFEASGDFAVLEPRTPGQTVCGVASAIRLRFGFEDVVVHIAREVTADRCLYDEVVRHEYRHVQVDRETIDAFAPRIEGDLNVMVARMGVVRGASPDAVWHEIRARIQALVSTDLRAFSQDVRKRQRFVDRPEEYRRISGVCGGAGARLLAAGR